jgi:plasmid stabilization system protein ParE
VATQVVLVPEAESGVREAYEWYESQDRGLEEEFLHCLESGFSQIAQKPEIFPIRFGSFRRILLRRFPFAVYYDHDNHSIYVYYIFHCSQNPAKLAKRLRKD